MIVAAFTFLLFAVAAALLAVAWRRTDGSAVRASRSAWQEFLRLIPRVAVGVIGSGFLAKALPQDVVIAWLGPGSGLRGTVLACIAGALTPGGPVVGFALGAAALKAGAELPQVVAYVTAWSLYTLNRVLIWELPSMPMRFVLVRMVVSVPFPFLAAFLARG